MNVCTHPNVEALESIARRRTEGHKLRTGIRDADLEVAIGVLLLEDHADGLLNVNQEPPGRGALLVVGHPARPLVKRVLERRGPLGIVAMGEGLEERRKCGGWFVDESKEARVAQRMAAYRAVSPCATEALLATVVGAGLAVNGAMLLVDEVHAGGVGERRRHGGYNQMKRD